MEKEGSKVYRYRWVVLPAFMFAMEMSKPPRVHDSIFARTGRTYAGMLHTVAVAQGISSDKGVDSCVKGSFPCPQVWYGNIKKGVLLKLCWEYGIMRNLPSARQMVYERRV